MEKISDRILKIANRENISVRALEQKIGCSNGVLSKSIQKGTDISSLWVSKIIETMPQYNAQWLLTGKGEIILDFSIGVGEDKFSNLQESQLTIDITKNSRKTHFLYQRIVDIDILLDEKFGIKREGGYAISEAKILNDTFFKKYDFIVDSMTYEQRVQFNNQLKQAIETFSDIFFERFKMLYKKLREK